MESYISVLTSLLTVAAILFGVWYTDIERALKIKISNPLDDKNKLDEIRNTLRSKAVPLCVISLLTAFIFLPVFLETVFSFIKDITAHKAVYDPVKTSFLFFIILLFFIGITIIIKIVQLIKILKENNTSNKG
jgi:hypothetical protein